MYHIIIAISIILYLFKDNMESKHRLYIVKKRNYKDRLYPFRNLKFFLFCLKFVLFSLEFVIFSINSVIKDFNFILSNIESYSVTFPFYLPNY